MTTPDYVPTLALLLLSAICAQDAAIVEKTATMCALLRDGDDERSDVLCAVAVAARERFAAGGGGLDSAELRLLTHLAA